MDFLCPSCQKMLTVPDQYAGTLMKCPLCQNTFQAPALPAQPPPLAVSVPPPSPPPPPPSDHPADVYGLKDPITATPPPVPPAAPAPPLTSVAASTGSAPPSLRAPAPSGPPVPPSTDYTGGFMIPFSPRVVPWIAPVCLALVFLLTFFPWVGYYWNGIGALTQGAWGAAVGSYAVDDQTLWQKVSGLDVNTAPPGMNVVLLLYVLVLLVSLPLAVFSALLPRMHQVRLPTQVDQFRQYRWALVSGLAVLGLLLLLVVQIAGFTMERTAHNAAQAKAQATEVSSDKERDWLKGKDYEALGIRRTVWYRLALLLQLVALIGAGLAFWLDYRNERQPVPQLALRW